MWIIPKRGKHAAGGEELLMAVDDQAQRESELLKQLLASREFSCPVCGYNLRGIESDTCPECGAQLDLRLVSADLKLGPWIAAILGVALPLGFGLIMTLLLSYIVFEEGSSGADEANVLGSFLLLTIVEGVALGLLLHKRKKFWRNTTQYQQTIATMCIGVSAILTTIVIAVLLNS
ncbi:MAG: hypothetical protein V3T84_03180 [Phycisphaerales bacterium]